MALPITRQGPERHGTAFWPGVIGVASCTYTASHGITPGVALLETLPQATAPAETGNLVISDGYETITIPDAKVNQLKVHETTTPSGDKAFVWTLEIVDRRWKWRELGEINGCYNQPDPHGKLIPWTIQSPEELALLCLDAMGEPFSKIDLPTGFTSDVGKEAEKLNPPWIGVQNTTGTNPPVNWEAEPPAHALAQLCELFGRRVIYQLSTDSILIEIPGIGRDLPPGSFAKASPAIKSPETPTGVTVVGSPTVFQCRLPLEAVGEDWDGSYRPIHELSYAPKTGAAKQIANATITDPPVVGHTLQLTVNGVTKQYQIAGGDTAATAAAHLLDLFTGIGGGAPGPGFGDPRIAGVNFSVAGGVILMTGGQNGVPFGFGINIALGLGGGNEFTAALVQPASDGTADWKYCQPPSFSGVQATNRLTELEARRLAQKSVWRCYRVAEKGFKPPPDAGPVAANPFAQNPFVPVVDSDIQDSGLLIPGYGTVNRRQQILLLPYQAEQIVPQPLDAQVFDKRAGLKLTVNFYNGYSRDKPAAVFGAVAVHLFQTFWVPDFVDLNTEDGDQVFVNFTINPVQQLVIFEGPVYYFQAARYLEPDLVLETGMNIRDNETNQLVAFHASMTLPGAKGPTNYKSQKFPDVQLNVIGVYDTNENQKLIGTTILEQDPVARANYYLQGMARQYIQQAGATIEYNGIRAIDLDGAIWQVTWEIGPGGAKTTASRNTEHSLYVPPYPKRRRAEFLQSLADNQNLRLGRSSLWSGSNPYTHSDRTQNLYTPL
jgi:hypothetical protein